MIVVDASAFVEVLVGGSRAPAVVRALSDDGEWVVAEHFMVEVLNTLRRLYLAGQLSREALAEAGERLVCTAFVVAPTRPSISRVIELAPNVSAHDAAYVALAESLDVPLVTADLRLVQANGPKCRFVEVG